MWSKGSYRKLVVWNKGIDLVCSIYALVKDFPIEERFVVSQQMRRAAGSIPNNIAEGSRRGSKKEFAHFLKIAYASGAELET